VFTSTPPLIIDGRDELTEAGNSVNDILSQTKNTVAAFHRSQDSLSELIKQIQTTAAGVAFASESLGKSARAAESASAEIAESVREIEAASADASQGANEVAIGSSAQAEAISNGAALLQRLSMTVRQAAKDAEGASQAVQTATTAATTGAETVEQSLAGMAGIRQTVLESAEIIGQLGQESSQIGIIVSTIEDIAMQTNLLSLNAAIEAARVGEAGNGFAVVADEVRKLAVRSRLATSEIKVIVDKFQARTSEAVKAMDGGVQGVEAGSALAEKAGQALSEIQISVAAVSERMDGIRTATSDITETSSLVSHQINDLAAVVEEASAAAEEMSASVSEVSSSISDVNAASETQQRSIAELTEASQHLLTVARQLEVGASRFMISSDESEKQKKGTPALRLVA
jgi:methyl-accepting chemotaxis protein